MLRSLATAPMILTAPCIGSTTDVRPAVDPTRTSPMPDISDRAEVT
jgi:hypothetical protein